MYFFFIAILSSSLVTLQSSARNSQSPVIQELKILFYCILKICILLWLYLKGSAKCPMLR